MDKHKEFHPNRTSLLRKLTTPGCTKDRYVIPTIILLLLLAVYFLSLIYVAMPTSALILVVILLYQINAQKKPQVAYPSKESLSPHGLLQTVKKGLTTARASKSSAFPNFLLFFIIFGLRVEVAKAENFTGYDVSTWTWNSTTLTGGPCPTGNMGPVG